MDNIIDRPVEVSRWKPNVKDNKSRYVNDDRIAFSDGYSQIETHDPVSISQDNTDMFYRVEAGYEDRLDLVSFKYYDTPMYWWIIAYASNVMDPFNVPIGTLLRIPKLSRVLNEVL